MDKWSCENCIFHVEDDEPCCCSHPEMTCGEHEMFCPEANADADDAANCPGFAQRD